jgi:hypothetical protein
MIKLLGSGPGLISQAFLVAKFILLIDPQESSISSLSYYLMARQKGDTNVSRQLASIVRNYFWAVYNEFTYAWPIPINGKYSAREYKFILCKSMVMSALLAILGDIYRLILLDFALFKEAEISSSEILSPEFFATFFKRIDIEGRADATKSIFSKESIWSIGGSAVLERKIYESLRSCVYVAYREMATLPECQYQKVCTQFKGSKRGLLIAQEYTSETEKAFWKKIEFMCNSESARAIVPVSGLQMPLV